MERICNAWISTQSADFDTSEVSGEMYDKRLTVCLVCVRVCRIENEHLTNVGKYRAEVAVPLPFDHAE